LAGYLRDTEEDIVVAEKVEMGEDTGKPPALLFEQETGLLRDTEEDIVVVEKVEMGEDTGKPPAPQFEKEPGFPEGIEEPADRLAGKSGQQAEELEGTVVGPVDLRLEHIEGPTEGVGLRWRHTEERAEEVVHRLAEQRPDRPARMRAEVLQHILVVEELALDQQVDILAGTQAASDTQAAGMPTDNLERLLLHKHLQIPLLADHLLHQCSPGHMATALQHMPGALRSLSAVGMALCLQEDHTPRTCLGHSPSAVVAVCTFLAAAAGKL
jgi:hypothetical protein